MNDTNDAINDDSWTYCLHQVSNGVRHASLNMTSEAGVNYHLGISFPEALPEDVARLACVTMCDELDTYGFVGGQEWTSRARLFFPGDWSDEEVVAYAALASSALLVDKRVTRADTMRLAAKILERIASGEMPRVAHAAGDAASLRVSLEPQLQERDRLLAQIAELRAKEATERERTKAVPAPDPSIEKALEIAVRFGGTDGDHHKAWVIDQMVRALTKCQMVKREGKDVRGDTFTFEEMGESQEYIDLVKEAKAGENGPNSYTWKTGTPP